MQAAFYHSVTRKPPDYKNNGTCMAVIKLYQKTSSNAANPHKHWVFTVFHFIRTRCRNLRLKQFCLEDIVPAILIILIAHIIIAVRWMFIKILSAVINHHGEYKENMDVIASRTPPLWT